MDNMWWWWWLHAPLVPHLTKMSLYCAHLGGPWAKMTHVILVYYIP